MNSIWIEAVKPFHPCALPARSVAHINHQFVCAYEQGLWGGGTHPCELWIPPQKVIPAYWEDIITAQALAFAGREK